MTWSHLHEHWEELVKLFEVRVLGQSEQGFDTGEEKKKGGHVAEHLTTCCPEKIKMVDSLNPNTYLVQTRAYKMPVRAQTAKSSRFSLLLK